MFSIFVYLGINRTLNQLMFYIQVEVYHRNLSVSCNYHYIYISIYTKNLIFRHFNRHFSDKKRQYRLSFTLFVGKLTNKKRI